MHKLTRSVEVDTPRPMGTLNGKPTRDLYGPDTSLVEGDGGALIELCFRHRVLVKSVFGVQPLRPSR